MFRSNRMHTMIFACATDATDCQNLCGTFYDFWDANRWQDHILREVFQNKVK